MTTSKPTIPTANPTSRFERKAAKASSKTPSVRIADNKKAAFNYHIEDRYEAGMVLQGWEVKAIRLGKVQLTDGYVIVRDGELFLIGCQINPIRTTSTPEYALRLPRILCYNVRATPHNSRLTA